MNREQENKITNDIAVKTQTTLNTLMKFVLPLISIGYIIVNLIAFSIFGSAAQDGKKNTEMSISQISIKVDSQQKFLDNHLIDYRAQNDKIQNALDNQGHELERVKDRTDRMDLKLTEILDTLKKRK